jgi:hypothetical protein
MVFAMMLTEIKKMWEIQHTDGGPPSATKDEKRKPNQEK